MQDAVTKTNEEKDTLFRNVNFILLFLGGVVSRIGNGIHHIGLVWYIIELKGSGLAVGTILMLSTLPGVILGPLSGVLVDRWNRKEIIVWMDVIRGVIAILMSFMMIGGIMNYTYLIIGTVLLSICGTLFNPAISASVPNIVKDKHLTQANSLEHISMNFTGVLGPMLGGILVAIWGVSGVFLINGISFLLSAVSELFIKFPPQKQVHNQNIEFLNEFKEGLSFIYHQKALFYLLFAALFANFLYGGSLAVGLPLIIKDSLQGTSQDLGIVEAAWPLGAILGGLILSILPELKKIYKTFVTAVSIQTVFWVGIGVIGLPTIIESLGIPLAKYIIIGCMALCGIFNAFVNVPIMVVLQRMIPDEKRGRVFSIISTLTQGLVPIAMGVSGIITGLVLPSYLFIFGGVGMIIVMLDFMRRKEVREM